jgi:trans-aconitate 2-methyltransferase
MKTIAHQWNPADYARHSQGQERWAKELLTLLAPKPQESILDIGCGDGRITAEIARLVRAGRALGVDRSPDMVRFAQEHFPPGQFPNLTFVQADASELPFEAEFDAVFSNAVLHWVLDHRPVLAGIARSLRPGGRCVLQMGGKGNGDEVVDVVEGCLADAKWQAEWRPRDSHYGFHGAEEYRAWMDDAGLEADSVELIEKDMVHESREAFTGWLRTAWHPYTTRVAAERREEFLEAVTERYLRERPADSEARVHVGMIRLQVLAHRPIAD